LETRPTASSSLTGNTETPNGTSNITTPAILYDSLTACGSASGSGATGGLSPLFVDLTELMVPFSLNYSVV